MEDKIVSVLELIKSELSFNIQKRSTEVLTKYDDLYNFLSSIIEVPIRIGDRPIVDYKKNFPSLSDETIMKLEVYIMLSRFSYFPLTNEQKNDIISLTKELMREVNNNREMAISSDELLRDGDSRLDEVNNMIIKVRNLYSGDGYLSSLDIKILSELLVKASLSNEEVTKIIQDVGLLSLKVINSSLSDVQDEDVISINESNLDESNVVSLFNEYGYDFYSLEKNDQELLLRYGNLTTISDILKAFKNNGITSDILGIGSYSHKILQILINSDGDIVNTIIRDVRDDFERCGKSYIDENSITNGLSFEELFRDCLNNPSIFIRGKRKYERKNVNRRKKRSVENTSSESISSSDGKEKRKNYVIGSYDNYCNIRNLLIEKGVDISAVRLKCSSLFSISYRRIKDNISSFEFYGVSDCYKNAISSLKAADPLSTIDQFIEVGCYMYILANFSYVIRRCDDLIFYRIIKGRQLNDSIYRYDNPPQFFGKISNEGQNGYGITEENKKSEVDQFTPVFDAKYDTCVNSERNSGPIIHAYNHPFIRSLEFFKRDNLQYNFNGVIISRLKVLRIYETLIKHNMADSYESILYAICKNSILTEEQYRNIKQCLDIGFGKGAVKK